ncbi:MAG: segregation/condensation protein A [Clostridia bacterium]|nr:segregation/condensation protein A [Clostridia bacterium]
MAEVSFKQGEFEGPLDLMLHLISKNKMNIYDISIGDITEQFFEYIRACEEFDVELSSEFMVMAAQLLLIKSKMLLPREEEDEDPREELVGRLEEYMVYKEIAALLDEEQHAADRIVFKGAEKLNLPRVQPINMPADAGALLAAVTAVMERAKDRRPLTAQSFRGIVNRAAASVPHQSRRVIEILRQKRRMQFERIFDGMEERAEIIATFLAILELVRDKHMLLQERGDRLICVRCDDFEGYEEA